MEILSHMRPCPKTDAPLACRLDHDLRLMRVGALGRVSMLSSNPAHAVSKQGMCPCDGSCFANAPKFFEHVPQTSCNIFRCWGGIEHEDCCISKPLRSKFSAMNLQNKSLTNVDSLSVATRCFLLGTSP